MLNNTGNLILRHPASERILHWAVAITFIGIAGRAVAFDRNSARRGGMGGIEYLREYVR